MSDAFARVPGAIIDERGLQHLGNPLGEQRALASGHAVAPLTDRAVIAVPGEDRLTWLDSLTSQALTQLAPGQSTELLVLDPQGRIEHAASVIDDGVTTWLIVDRADAQVLLGWLRKMRFRLRVDPRDASDEFAVVGGTTDALAALDVAAPADVPLIWRDPWPEISVGGYGYAAVEPHPGAERDWAEALVAPAAMTALAEAAVSGQQKLAGLIAVDALRIAAWRPRWATEVDERVLPHEVDWLRTAVHLQKGCYRGQETVAKVHNLGHPPRRLIALQLDGSDSVMPSAGADVRLGDDVIGTVTSSALHYEDGPIALAIVRRSAATDASLIVQTDAGAIAAAQEVIVPPEAGATANIPRMPRLGRRAAAK